MKPIRRGFARVCAISFRHRAACGRLRTIGAVANQSEKREYNRVIFENNELSDVWDAPDESNNVSVPVSMVMHASGAIDIVVVDLTEHDERGCFAERRIRFSPQAAAQFLDTMSNTVQSGHVLFGDERPEKATLH
jgi:hypothetical protein